MKKLIINRGYSASTNTREGFALFYVLIIVGVVLVSTSVFLESALEELFITAERENSEMAWYMAETGIGCAEYHHNENRAFFMRTLESEYRCKEGSGDTFSAGWRDEFSEENALLNSTLDTCYWDSDRILVTGLMDPDNHEYDNEEYEIFGLREPIVLWSEDGEACARVTAAVVSERISMGDEGSISVCNIQLRSVGADRCNSDGFPATGAVERVRIKSVM